MKIVFKINYHTQWGQRLFICGDLPEMGSWNPQEAAALDYLGDGQWELAVELKQKDAFSLSYKYFLAHEQGGLDWEWGDDRPLQLDPTRFDEAVVEDAWRPAKRDNNALYSSAFTRVLMRRTGQGKATENEELPGSLYRLQLYAPRVDSDHKLCVSGGHPALGNWDEKKALVMDDSDFPLWKVDIPLRGISREVEYKYGIYHPKKKQIQTWEEGENRRFHYQAGRKLRRLTVHTEDDFRYPLGNWKGAGLAVPVFSLRSDKSAGVGEFTDLKTLVDWAEQTHLKLVQILPINDTVATHTWVDSYPYGAISVYALHPMYLNMPAMGTLKDQAAMEEFIAGGRKLNELPEVDYEGVMKLKSRFFKALYDQEKKKFLRSKKFKEFFQDNEDWLVPYAAFSALRDRFGTANFRQWSEYSEFDREAITQFCNPEQAHYDDIAVHYFIQYHLHVQLLEAATYARKRGVILKGDIPIGIYRHSVDAWVAPQLYNMESQAGAPPDAFAQAGQNWRFPTYNWHEMAKDDYAWWRKRMTQMATYFDAYRIDHILGFFRIWEIPGSAVQGILGQFNPALSFNRAELAQRGVWMDYDRLCKPYIREHLLPGFFHEHDLPRIKDEFLDEYAPGSFNLKPHVDTQRKVEAYCAQKSQEMPQEKGYYDYVRPALYGLIAEVVFLEAPLSQGEAFAPRIACQHTKSFQELDGGTQEAINRLYVEYFYKRQDEFWAEQARIKLPAIKNATNMLVCGEDLGMVPDCVPPVMEEMGMLSLEIQRMPKNPKDTFGHPAHYPYLSVNSTSTHDMPPLRSWWEEDRAATQEFFNHILGHHGEAPYFCEPWLAQEILNQHLYSPSMWAIFPLQDLLAIDGGLRQEDPHGEQINVPANPEHYWRYRLHLSLEELLAAQDYNKLLGQLVQASGRAAKY